MRAQYSHDTSSMANITHVIYASTRCAHVGYACVTCCVSTFTPCVHFASLRARVASCSIAIVARAHKTWSCANASFIDISLTRKTLWCTSRDSILNVVNIWKTPVFVDDVLLQKPGFVSNDCWSRIARKSWFDINRHICENAISTKQKGRNHDHEICINRMDGVKRRQYRTRWIDDIRHVSRMLSRRNDDHAKSSRIVLRVIFNHDQTRRITRLNDTRHVDAHFAHPYIRKS